MVNEAVLKTAVEVEKIAEKETKKMIKETEKAASNQPTSQDAEIRRSVAEAENNVKSEIKIAAAWGKEIAACEEIEY